MRLVMIPREPRPPFPQTARAGDFVPQVFAPRTVLLVDDDAEVRHVFGLFLRQAGHIVLEACDGAEAQRATMEHPEIDVLVTDYTMPGMNGAELADWFRSAMPSTRVLIISGTSEAKDAADERGLPMLEKPISLWVFTRLVEELARAKAA